MSAVSGRPTIFSIDAAKRQELEAFNKLKQLSKNIKNEFWEFCAKEPLNEEEALHELRQYIEYGLSAIERRTYLLGLSILLHSAIAHHKNTLMQEIVAVHENVQQFVIDHPNVNIFAYDSDPNLRVELNYYEGFICYAKKIVSIQSLFMHAMQSKNAEAVRFFLRKRAIPNRVYGQDTKYDYPEKYDSPMHHAVFLADTKILSIILDHGGDPNLKSNNAVHQNTPVDMAEKLQNKEIIDLLKSRGGLATPTTRLPDIFRPSYWFQQTASTSGTSEQLPEQLKQTEV